MCPYNLVAIVPAHWSIKGIEMCASVQLMLEVSIARNWTVLNTKMGLFQNTEITVYSCWFRPVWRMLKTKQRNWTVLNTEMGLFQNIEITFYSCWFWTNTMKNAKNKTEEHIFPFIYLLADHVLKYTETRCGIEIPPRSIFTLSGGGRSVDKAMAASVEQS
jgi:hypothetical protein